MPTEYQASYNGPTWQDVFATAAEMERSYRIRIAFRMGTRVRAPGKGIIEALASRQHGRSDWAVVGHVEEFWPSRHGRTMTAVLYRMLLDLGSAVDSYDHRALTQQPMEIVELPLPPQGE